MIMNLIRAFRSTPDDGRRFADPAWVAQERKRAVVRDKPSGDKAAWLAEAKRQSAALAARLKSAEARQ